MPPPYTPCPECGTPVRTRAGGTPWPLVAAVILTTAAGSLAAGYLMGRTRTAAPPAQSPAAVPAAFPVRASQPVSVGQPETAEPADRPTPLQPEPGRPLRASEWLDGVRKDTEERIRQGDPAFKSPNFRGPAETPRP